MTKLSINFMVRQLFLLIALLAVSFSALAEVGERFVVDGIAYEILSETTGNYDVAVIPASRYDSTFPKYSGDIKIPSTVIHPDRDKKYHVAKIDDGAFEDCTALTSINFHSGDEVGYRAFAGCTSLQSASIGSHEISSRTFEGCTSLKSASISSIKIGNSSFAGCTSLQSAYISSDEIGSRTFEGCTSLMSAELPCIEIIEDYTFAGCSALNSVSVNFGDEFSDPVSYRGGFSDLVYLARIGKGAFAGCSSLTFTIPETVAEIGEAAFQGCSSLKTMTIPASVTELPNQIFQGCTLLETVTIPETVTKIGEAAFQGCKSLTSVAIPSSIKRIEANTFKGCSSLGTFTLPKLMTYIGDSAFEGCASFDFERNKSDYYYTIPKFVQHIGDGAFKDCKSIKRVTIPSSTTYIGSSAFQNCSSMQELMIFSGTVTAIGNSAFQGCSALCSLDLDGWLTELGTGIFKDCTNLKTVTIPKSMTEIPSLTFQGCTSLKSVEIHNAVTSIGDSAFQYCVSLASITIPNSVTTIGETAFRACGFSSISIPTTVESIGESAFTDCSKLASADINAKNIGSSAFANLGSLKSVTFGSNVALIGKEAFKGCGMTEVSIPKNVENIGESAFAECKSLASADINSRVIGSNAFRACGLLKITIPSNVEHIGESVFTECNSLATADVNARTIGANAFKNLNSLKTISFGDNVTTIENEAFSGCGISTVSIPANVETIGDAAFTCCNALASADINAKTIGSKAFNSLSSLKTATFGERVSVIGDEAFASCSIANLELSGVLNKIGKSAFADCISLSSADIDALEIENTAFSGCNSLETFAVRDKLTIIPEGLFKNLAKLKTVQIGNGVTTIGEDSFSGCQSLEKATFGNSLTDLNSNIFNGCKSLTEINISADNASLYSEDGVVYSKDKRMLKYCPGGKIGEFAIPNYVANIATGAFNHTVSITDMHIGSSLENLQGDEFAHCQSLSEVSVSTQNETFCAQDGVVYTKDNSTLVVYPRGSKRTSFTVPNTVSVIGYSAFYGSSSLTSVNTTNVITIGNSAFAGCDNLKTLSLGEKTEIIGENCFSSNSLGTIYSCAVNPPAIYQTTFTWDTYQNTMLYVPTSRGIKYVESEWWREFRNVEEMDSGVEDVVGEEAVIRVVDGSIVIDGAAADVPVEVYDMTGKTVYSGAAAEIPSMPRGIYIVRIGGKSVKVAV